MKIKAEEISSVLRKQIQEYRSALEVADVGQVLEVGDGIARVYGLSNAMAGELLEFEGGIFGQVLNLEESSIGAAIFGDYLKIKEGMQVKGTGKVLEVPVGTALIGRVVNPLGQPLDGLGPIRADRYRAVELIAPGIADRQPVKQPLQTGIKAIDAMTPIGRGQRELIIGDRKTGKTAIAIDAIINQKSENVVCVYVAIGQKESTVAGVVETLKKHGAMDYTIVVSSSASDPAPMQYVAPYAGCAMAEEFMYNQHRDTLVVYDDLTKHAQAYRQLSLLLRRPPGREAYPGDVFYLHSRLLERAVKLSDDLGAGSLTALPIIETQEGEVSAYIPTNVISITDGQIYLVPDLFFAGVRPAVDVGISVSRVGGNAQVKGMRKVAGSLRLDLASYRELEAFAQLGTELDPATQKRLDRGARMVELLKQPQYRPMSVVDQILVIYAGTQGHLDSVPLERVRDFERALLEGIRHMHPEFRESIASAKEIPADVASKLDAAIAAIRDGFLSGKAADPR
jgi:F-type H+-transporting ATPase subunit alpha